MGGWEVITIYPENGRRENVEEKAGYENEDRLSKEEYEMTQDILLDHARMISLLPLEAFLNSLRHAKEIVPFIDPTLFLKTAYGQGADNIQAISEIAEAALKIKIAVTTYRGKYTKRLEKEACNS